MTTETARPNLRNIKYRVFYRPADNPLETFYLPTLAASVQYDRSAGYFRSSALAVAAAGVARLIQNNGRMRLLVGAELSEQDVEAIRRGYDLRETLAQGMLGHFPDPGTGPLRQRLEALAWMVANGTLDIKVVLPLDAEGMPIPGPAAQEYYHSKKGIFTDAEGNQVGFIGSINESAQAWLRNFEEFSVHLSWEGERERMHVGNLRAAFNELWEGKDRDWLAVEMPEAVQRELLRYTPDRPPQSDPLERPRRPQVGDGRGAYSPVTLDEQVLFQFLRDAPYLVGAADLGAQTSAIRPWPHQVQVARAVVNRFPDRVLLADEVGLGKTIEAGLVIRQLILSGRVKRCLILTPAAVLRQWQEELYEKFNLEIPRYDDRQLWDVRGRPFGPPSAARPWDECDLLLASSHLARRRERVEELATARPWDLLVVDEAHHARRKDFLQPVYRPNRLLTLLNRLKEANQYQGLLLMTATPMQVHPVEVWDLLTVLGLGGRWGADENNFLAFFKELRRPYGEADWDLVFDLVAESLEGEGIDGSFEQVMRRQLGPAHANAIRNLPGQPRPRRATLRSLPAAAHSYVAELARQHTPLRRYLFRNTRQLLRRYVEQGVLQARVPTRRPAISRIHFRPEEEALYKRITEYISHFYQRYENERRGLGFIMTVYRRRLTSSFYAIRASLERRRDWLRGQLEPVELLAAEEALEEVDEDEEGLDLTAFRNLPGLKEQFQRELEYLDDFIGELRNLSQADSKLAYLKDQLEQIFRQRPTVLIFTQYTDTMDYLREQLQTVYGRGVACYSGRGGETWNGIAWVMTPKEMVKNRFRDGEIKILLCTESASEGLNLQTCGVLINYDMPWNPMRVEQRIGRIDRIGQDFPQVWIHNYFYQDTIEDRIYQALADRINWFEEVVGDLQPILAAIGEVTRKLAMLPAEAQAAAFEAEMRAIRQQIELERQQALNLTDYLDPARPDSTLNSPVTLADLEAVLTQAQATRHLFQPHPDIEGAYWLTLASRDSPGESQVAVTFSAERFDEHPDTLQFLSYGSPLLAQLLDRVPEPAEPGLPSHLARFAESEPFPLRGWYSLRGGKPAVIGNLAQLRRELGQGDKETPAGPGRQGDKEEAARRVFAGEAEGVFEAYQRQAARHRARQQATLQARARRLLEKAAILEILLGQQQGLFADEGYPTGFSEAAVSGLKRHKSPWSWMLMIGERPLPRPQPDDPYYAQVQNERPERLKQLFSQLTEEAKDVLAAHRRMNKT